MVVKLLQPRRHGIREDVDLGAVQAQGELCRQLTLEDQTQEAQVAAQLEPGRRAVREATERTFREPTTPARTLILARTIEARLLQDEMPAPQGYDEAQYERQNSSEEPTEDADLTMAQEEARKAQEEQARLLQEQEEEEEEEEEKDLAAHLTPEAQKWVREHNMGLHLDITAHLTPEAQKWVSQNNMGLHLARAAQQERASQPTPDAEPLVIQMAADDAQPLAIAIATQPDRQADAKAAQRWQMDHLQRNLERMMREALAQRAQEVKSAGLPAILDEQKLPADDEVTIDDTDTTDTAGESAVKGAAGDDEEEDTASTIAEEEEEDFVADEHRETPEEEGAVEDERRETREGRTTADEAVVDDEEGSAALFSLTAAAVAAIAAVLA